MSRTATATASTSTSAPRTPTQSLRAILSPPHYYEMRHLLQQQIHPESTRGNSNWTSMANSIAVSMSNSMANTPQRHLRQLKMRRMSQRSNLDTDAASASAVSASMSVIASPASLPQTLRRRSIVDRERQQVPQRQQQVLHHDDKEQAADSSQQKQPHSQHHHNPEQHHLQQQSHESQSYQSRRHSRQHESYEELSQQRRYDHFEEREEDQQQQPHLDHRESRHPQIAAERLHRDEDWDSRNRSARRRRQVDGTEYATKRRMERDEDKESTMKREEESRREQQHLKSVWNQTSDPTPATFLPRASASDHPSLQQWQQQEEHAKQEHYHQHLLSQLESQSQREQSHLQQIHALKADLFKLYEEVTQLRIKERMAHSKEVLMRIHSHPSQFSPASPTASSSFSTDSHTLMLDAKDLTIQLLRHELKQERATSSELRTLYSLSSQNEHALRQQSLHQMQDNLNLIRKLKEYERGGAAEV